MVRKSLQRLNNNLEQGTLLFLFTLLIVLTAIQVFRRFVLNSSTAWNVEVITYIYIFASWVGASYVVRRRYHLKMDLLQSRLPDPVRIATLAVSNLLFVALLLYITLQIYPVVTTQRATGRTIVGAPSVELWWIYSSIPLALGLMVLRILQNLAEDIRLYRESNEFAEGESIFGVD